MTKISLKRTATVTLRHSEFPMRTLRQVAGASHLSEQKGSPSSYSSTSRSTKWDTERIRTNLNLTIPSPRAAQDTIAPLAEMALFRQVTYAGYLGMTFHPQVLAEISMASLKAIAVKVSEFCNRLKHLANPELPYGVTDAEVAGQLKLCPTILVPEDISTTTYTLLLQNIETEIGKQKCPTLYRVHYNNTSYICTPEQKDTIFADYERQKHKVERNLKLAVWALSMTGAGVFLSGVAVVATSTLSTVGLLTALESNVVHSLLLILMLGDLGKRVAPKVEKLFFVSRPRVEHAPFTGTWTLSPQQSASRVSYQLTEVRLDAKSSVDEEERLATGIQDGCTEDGASSFPMLVLRPKNAPLTGPLTDSHRLVIVKARKQQTPTEAYLSVEDYLYAEYPDLKWTQAALFKVFSSVYDTQATPAIDFDLLREKADSFAEHREDITYADVISFTGSQGSRFATELEPIPPAHSQFTKIQSKDVKRLVSVMVTKYVPPVEELAPTLIGAPREKETVAKFLEHGQGPQQHPFKILEIQGPFGTGKTHLSFAAIQHAHETHRYGQDQKRPFKITENGHTYTAFLGPEQYAEKLREIAGSNPILSSKLIIAGIATFGVAMTSLYLAQLHKASEACGTDQEEILVRSTTSFVESIATYIQGTGLNATQIAESFAQALQVLKAPTDQELAPGSQAFPIFLPGIPCSNVGTIKQTIQLLSMATLGALTTFWSCVKTASSLSFQRHNSITLVPPLEPTFSFSADLPETDDEIEALLLRIYASQHGCLYLQNGQHVSADKLQRLLKQHQVHLKNKDTSLELMVIITTNPGKGDAEKERDLTSYCRNTIRAHYKQVELPARIEDEGEATTRQLSFLLDHYCKINNRPPLNSASKALIIDFIRQLATYEGQEGHLDIGRKFQQILSNVHWELNQTLLQVHLDDLITAYHATMIESAV